MSFPKKVLDTIKNSLQKEREKILTTLESLAAQDPYSDPDRLNDNAASDTEASEESSHERMEALEKELKKHLDEINTAINRLTDGTYGKCLSCGQLISIERLGVKPTALYCVTCEKKKEK